jgi:hypothetical protein
LENSFTDVYMLESLNRDLKDEVRSARFILKDIVAGADTKLAAEYLKRLQRRNTIETPRRERQRRGEEEEDNLTPKPRRMSERRTIPAVSSQPNFQTSSTQINLKQTP